MKKKEILSIITAGIGILLLVMVNVITHTKATVHPLGVPVNESASHRPTDIIHVDDTLALAVVVDGTCVLNQPTEEYDVVNILRYCSLQNVSYDEYERLASRVLRIYMHEHGIQPKINLAFCEQAVEVFNTCVDSLYSDEDNLIVSAHGYLADYMAMKMTRNVASLPVKGMAEAVGRCRQTYDQWNGAEANLMDVLYTGYSLAGTAYPMSESSYLSTSERFFILLMDIVDAGVTHQSDKGLRQLFDLNYQLMNHIDKWPTIIPVKINRDSVIDAYQSFARKLEKDGNDPDCRYTAADKIHALDADKSSWSRYMQACSELRHLLPQSVLERFDAAMSLLMKSHCMDLESRFSY